jgi:hypothetical protein
VAEKFKSSTFAEKQIQRLENLRLENDRQAQKMVLKSQESPRTAVERTIERLEAMREMASQSGPAMPPVILTDPIRPAQSNEGVVSPQIRVEIAPAPPSAPEAVIAPPVVKLEAVAAPTAMATEAPPQVPSVAPPEEATPNPIAASEEVKPNPAVAHEAWVSPEEKLRAAVEKAKWLETASELRAERDSRPLAPPEKSECVLTPPPSAPLPPPVAIPEPIQVTPPAPPPMAEADPSMSMEELEDVNAEGTQTSAPTAFARFEGRFKNVKLSVAQMKLLEKLFDVDPRLYPARILRLALNRWLEMPNLTLDEALEPLSRDALDRIKKGL